MHGEAGFAQQAAQRFMDMHPDEIPEGFSKFMLEEIEASDFEVNTFGQQMLLSFRQIKV